MFPLRESRPMIVDTEGPSVLSNRQLFNITIAKSVSTLKLNPDLSYWHSGSDEKVFDLNLDTEKIPIPISEDMEAVMKRASPEMKLTAEGNLPGNMSQNRIYMDYNATTPLDPEVIKAIHEALTDAWGNPSSTYTAGVKAKTIINESRENVARMVGGKAEDIIFTSGGTEANNMVIQCAVEHFRRNCDAAEQNGCPGLPHLISSNVEHDSVKLVLEHLQREGKAELSGKGKI
ncbi:hypothetical protein WMY93_024364 [Mugilogobius chulae]|uniref:Selenocysteine lyase n=1 Tax=Mugilogobius chulae TaxID=88201 RepID=A0AAW0N3T6_9GOBI